MTQLQMPDTSFLLSPEELVTRKKKDEELEMWREQSILEGQKVEKIIGRIKPTHDIDPKQHLLDKYSEIIKNIPIHGASVLVVIYRRPERTKGGVILSAANLDEDLYQGKVGLVLKTGPYPADEEDMKFFDGRLPEVGDWVVFRASDGTSFGLLDKKGDCRFLKDRRSIWMKIPDPDVIW